MKKMNHLGVICILFFNVFFIYFFSPLLEENLWNPYLHMDSLEKQAFGLFMLPLFAFYLLICGFILYIDYLSLNFLLDDIVKNYWVHKE